MENRNGMIVDALLTQADGTAERDAAMILMHRQYKRNQQRGAMTLGADKAYDTRDLVSILREMNVRPHVAQNVNRSSGSAIDKRTTRHVGYEISQRKRPPIEKAFGWMKQPGGMRKNKAERSSESGMAISNDGSGVQPLEVTEAVGCSDSRHEAHHVADSARMRHFDDPSETLRDLNKSPPVELDRSPSVTRMPVL